jgi:hypothetical protein
MALSSVHVRIDTLRVPAGTALDPVDLCERVELELAALLTRMPLPERRGSPDVWLKLGGGRVNVAATATDASVAYALARHVHSALACGEARA